jgi:predicted transcriptional regulator
VLASPQKFFKKSVVYLLTIVYLSCTLITTASTIKEVTPVTSTTKLIKEANQYMAIAEKYIKMDCHSAVSGSLVQAERLLRQCEITRGAEKAWERFAKLNTIMCNWYEGS